MVMGFVLAPSRTGALVDRPRTGYANGIYRFYLTVAAGARHGNWSDQPPSQLVKSLIFNHSLAANSGKTSFAMLICDYVYSIMMKIEEVRSIRCHLAPVQRGRSAAWRRLSAGAGEVKEPQQVMCPHRLDVPSGGCSGESLHNGTISAPLLLNRNEIKCRGSRGRRKMLDISS